MWDNFDEDDHQEFLKDAAQGAIEFLSQFSTEELIALNDSEILGFRRHNEIMSMFDRKIDELRQQEEEEIQRVLSTLDDDLKRMTE